MTSRRNTSLDLSIIIYFLWILLGSSICAAQSNTYHPISAKGPPGFVSDKHCKNSPKNRACWGGGFDITTNFGTKWPETGKVVEYLLEVSNITLAPDGVERLVLAINGQFPGPTIRANWGDTLRIHVKNNLQNNGTSIHWHGIRQQHTGHQDGTNGVTECPIAPGASKTYEFKCTQYGTSWYHSHHTVQYGDGVLGAIEISGPASANYDIDLGTMPIQDWYYRTAWENALLGIPPVAENGLINGTMVNANGGGKYHENTIQKGKSYRLRLINTSVDNYFKVHLDNHLFTVISSDFVAILPYQTDWLFLGIGQRYDVIIHADQEIDNYWFRAEVQRGCGENAMNGRIKSIFRYKGADPNAEPTSVASNYTQSCDDEQGLVPFVPIDVPSEHFIREVKDLNVTFEPEVTSPGQNIVHWKINGIPIETDWEYPTLQYVLDRNTSFAPKLNVIELPEANVWTYWIIQAIPGSIVNVPHPIHLHGHDFSVLGTGRGDFPGPERLNFTNPPRRDTVMLPDRGWVAIAFPTDNPGAWLAHCHIAWHAHEGLAVQFVERYSDIAKALDIPHTWHKTCEQWTDYIVNDAIYQQERSGI
ncbi:laccase 3, variant 1 [Blastomyces gilchristii SLH14081]|uniref:laccase n=1 Tax=Blastomyces gilchristii (strain SLH14081) TaxID=559298 RepID=A0A179UQ27_BLAGS|nr:laccase 3 [Blastomyces gilchristii SLH14081]XP_031579078.1 laccase 3, variant 1 [Blastomyces gilchristii SLH14081]OAT09933.1 laccase 3 [Blastomyces gilchristii SLH14081]OAT09934.1 laccase 3, variant 1 [Blastomyces gilchristii SLH14081]